MTSIAQTLNTVTCKVCDAVASYVKITISNIQHSRQMAANREVARQLHYLNLGDGKEYKQILDSLNDKTQNEYLGKY